MKKKTLLIVSLFLLTFLNACGNISIPPMPTATPVPVYTAVPTSTPEPVADTSGFENQVIVSIQDIELQYLDPIFQSYEILNFRCQVPSIHIENNDTASANINSIITENCSKIYSGDEGVDVILDKRNELLSLAEDNFSEENLIEFKYSRLVQIIRADDNLIVIQFNDSCKTFGDEEISQETIYFDTKSGNQIDETSAQSIEFEEPEKKENGLLTVSETAPTDKDVMDLVIDEEEGSDYYLTCDGVIYDLLIGDKWYCNILKDKTVQLRTIIPEGMPTLSISYTSGGEVYIYIFGKDLDNGNVSLLNSDEIEAVG